MLIYQGQKFYRTGKTGTNLATGESSAEFEAETTNGTHRVWLLASGVVVEE